MSIMVDGRGVRYLCRGGRVVEHAYLDGKAAYLRNWFPDFDYEDDRIKAVSHAGRIVFSGDTKGNAITVARYMFQPGVYRITGDWTTDQPAFRIGKLWTAETMRWPARSEQEAVMTVSKPITLDLGIYGSPPPLHRSRPSVRLPFTACVDRSVWELVA